MENQHQVPAPVVGLAGRATPPFRLTAYGVSAAIPAAAISISLTQVLIGVTVLVFLVEWLRLGRPLTAATEGLGHPESLLVGGLIFVWLLLSFAVHFSIAGDGGAVFRAASSRELSDLPLYGFAWVVLVAARHPDNRRLIYGSLLSFAVIVIISGLLGLFSEFRLARVLTGQGAVASARNRPQHLAFEWQGFRIFRPIGLMNTRLTYAGLLFLCLPALAYSVYARRGPSKIAVSALLVGALVVLRINATRSAWFGLMAPAALTLLTILLYGRRAARVAAWVALAAIGLVMLGSLLHPSLRKGVMSLAKNELLRYTDAERPVLWAGSADMIRERPILGIGPGAFPEAQQSWRKGFTDHNPMTFYWVNNSPDGHAHNDLLHLAVVGGMPAAALFVLLSFFLVRRSLDPGLPGMARAFLMGCAALFPAGLFQCYFQDDEVVTVFWILLGLAGAAGDANSRKDGYERGK